MKLIDSDGTISNEVIDAFEKEYRILLPNNYRAFLLKYNGGYLDEYHNFLAGFNSLYYHKNNPSLETTFKTYCTVNKDLDLDYLPIGYTHTDNPVTICLANTEEYGKIIIFYFDRDEEPEIVANSLEELLGVNSIDEL